MDGFVFAGIAGQDGNRGTVEEVLHVFSDNSLRVIQECDNSIRLVDRQSDTRLQDIHEKGMPAWDFEIQTT